MKKGALKPERTIRPAHLSVFRKLLLSQLYKQFTIHLACLNLVFSQQPTQS